MVTVPEVCKACLKFDLLCPVSFFGSITKAAENNKIVIVVHLVITNALGHVPYSGLLTKCIANRLDDSIIHPAEHRLPPPKDWLYSMFQLQFEWCRGVCLGPSYLWSISS